MQLVQVLALVRDLGRGREVKCQVSKGMAGPRVLVLIPNRSRQLPSKFSLYYAHTLKHRLPYSMCLVDKTSFHSLLNQRASHFALLISENQVQYRQTEKQPFRHETHILLDGERERETARDSPHKQEKPNPETNKPQSKPHLPRIHQTVNHSLQPIPLSCKCKYRHRCISDIPRPSIHPVMHTL